MRYKYLFGPVPSRRLGMSLGVDLVPHKVCTLNCVYCEVGVTGRLTLERKEYLPYGEIIPELDSYLATEPELDYVTFSGAGEPLLNSRLGDINRYIKENYPQYQTALITNGTLLYDPEVRREIMNVDVILPSLDAVIEETFRKINRGHGNLKIDEIVEGLIKFSSEYSGRIWLEVFIIPGLNDSAEELEKMKEVLLKIAPDKVQLNSLDRPGTENWIERPEGGAIKKTAEFMRPLPVEIVSKHHTTRKSRMDDSDIEERIKGFISRRPGTVEDFSEALGVPEERITEVVNEMEQKGAVTREMKSRGLFYKLVK